ncbi:MAG: MazG family protein [Alicyclobacillus sp.]|nr:MazG family protein [Alicyclobacillus sp.]
MAKVYVVGLGPGDMSLLPLGSYRLLTSGRPVYLRTSVHPVVDALREEGISFTSFDPLYERMDRFPDVYRRIAEELIGAARMRGDIVYAVPGHPLMAEQSVQNLLSSGAVEVVVGPGHSFLDSVYAAVQADPVEGFLLLDGTALEAAQLRPDMHTWIAQVYSTAVASDVKLTLMEVYPDDYPVTVVRGAGVPGVQRCRRVPLYELDRLDVLDHLTTVFVPKTDDGRVRRRDPWYVAQLVARLRAPGGCPWDRRQTHESLRPYVLEEAYEVAEAIDKGDPEALAGELGDLFLQVLLHAQIAQEAGDFSIRDVYAALSDKLIRRHPHVFGDRRAKDAAEAERLWREAKGKEEVNEGRTAGSTPDTGQADGGGPPVRDDSVLKRVKRAGPALTVACRLQRAAAGVGFDWPDAWGALEKVREEVDELAQEMRQAVSSGGANRRGGGGGSAGEADGGPPGTGEGGRTFAEFGDLLFAVVNVGRLLGLDGEAALAAANQKFERRFAFVEEAVRQSGKRWEEMTLEELDVCWEQAKRAEREAGSEK